MDEWGQSLERIERGILRPTAEQLNVVVDETAWLEADAVVYGQVIATASEIPFLLHPGFEVQEIIVNRKKVAHAQEGKMIHFARLPQDITLGTELKIQMRWKGTYTLGCRATEAGHRWYEFNLGTLWYPVFSLDLRDGAAFRVTAELPRSLHVVATYAASACQTKAPERTHYSWDTGANRSLDFAFVAGNGEFAERHLGKMKLTAFTPYGVHPESVLTVAEKILSLYASLWGPCPFPQLTVACPPGSVTGNCAREGLVIAGEIGSEGLGRSFSVLAHEIAHQWWGIGIRFDATRPGCVEGLAAYASLIATRHLLGKEALRNSLAQDYLPRAKVAEAHKTALFDCTLTMPYSEDLREKRGGCAFLLLEQTIGEEAMAAGLRRFAKRFLGKSATPADLQACLAEIADQDRVNAFFDAYLAGTEPLPDSVDCYVH